MNESEQSKFLEMYKNANVTPRMLKTLSPRSVQNYMRPFLKIVRFQKSNKPGLI